MFTDISIENYKHCFFVRLLRNLFKRERSRLQLRSRFKNSIVIDQSSTIRKWTQTEQLRVNDRKRVEQKTKNLFSWWTVYTWIDSRFKSNDKMHIEDRNKKLHLVRKVIRMDNRKFNIYSTLIHPRISSLGKIQNSFHESSSAI